MRYLLSLLFILSLCTGVRAQDTLVKQTGLPYFKHVPTEAPRSERSPSVAWVIDSAKWYYYDYPNTVWRQLSGSGGEGLDGNTVISLPGAPTSSVGRDGDLYYDIDNKRFYGPKAGGAWGNGVLFSGPPGPAGADGTSVTIVGSVPTQQDLPNPYGGSIGEMILSEDNGHGHVWQGNGWLDVGEIRGPEGPQGVAGEDGSQGPQGDRGLTGSQGPQGVPGEDGAPGVTGPAGATGATGPQGATGVAGGVGPQGPQGDDGAVGATGEPGQDGTDGLNGNNGTQGVPGDTGAQGEIGPAGPEGPAGADGAPGPQGNEGPEGPQGLTGATGSQGPEGPEASDDELVYSGSATPLNFDYNDSSLRQIGVKSFLRPSNVNGPPEQAYYFLMCFGTADAGSIIQVFWPANNTGGGGGLPYYRHYNGLGYGPYEPFSGPLDWMSITGIPADLLDGDNVEDADPDPNNEIQDLTYSNGQFCLTGSSEAFGAFDVDGPAFGFNQDFDNFKTPGIYNQLFRSSNVNSPENDGYYYLMVIGSSSGGNVTQVTIPGVNDFGNCYFRQWRPGQNAWTNWKLFGEQVQAGTNVTINRSNPQEPVINVTQDGNGIYSGSGTVPTNTRASGYSYPGSGLGDARLEFSSFYQNAHNTRFYALDRTGSGIDFRVRINSNGDNIGAYLRVHDRDINGYTSTEGDGIFQQSNFGFRGLDWSLAQPRWKYGNNNADYYENEMLTRPAQAGVMLTRPNGETIWQEDIEESRDIETDQNAQSSFPTAAYLPAPVGTYEVSAGKRYSFVMTIWYTTGNNTTPPLLRFRDTGTSITGRYIVGSDDGTTSTLTGSTVIAIPTSTTERKMTIHGRFQSSGNGTVIPEVLINGTSLTYKFGTQIVYQQHN